MDLRKVYDLALKNSLKDWEQNFFDEEIVPVVAQLGSEGAMESRWLEITSPELLNARTSKYWCGVYGRNLVRMFHEGNISNLPAYVRSQGFELILEADSSPLKYFKLTKLV